MSEYGYLAHSGRSKRDGAKVGSGRYRYGSGDRPYQHVVGYVAKGAKSAGSKLASAINNYSKKRKAKAEQVRAERAEAAKRAEVERLEKEQAARQEELERKERFKREIIESGDMKLVTENKNILSNEEINEAITRFDTFQALDAKKKKQFKSGWEKMDSVFDKVGKLNNYSEKTILLYNRVANVANAFNKDGDYLPRISTDFTSGLSAIAIAKDKAKMLAEREQQKEEANAKKEQKQQEKNKESLEKEVSNREEKSEKEAAKEQKQAEKEEAQELKKHEKAYKKIQNKLDDSRRKKEAAERKQAWEDNKRAEKEAAEKQKKLEYDKAVFDVNRYGEGPSESTNKKEYDDVKARSDRALSLINSWSNKSSNSLNDKLMEDLAELKAEGKKGREIIERLDDEEMDLFFKMLNSKK